MRIFPKWFALILLALVFTRCSDDNEVIDTEYPVIDIDFDSAFPKQCSVLTRGESTSINIRLSDNEQLGAFSLDIHHNFDHHSHSTEVEDCNMEPIKVPVKPFLLIRNYSIPTGLKEYETNVAVEIPADVDPGDYHFLILLTDQEGWQSLKGVSIKIQ